MDGIHQVLEEAGIEHAMTGHPAMFGFVLGASRPPREYREVMATDMHGYEKICAAMRARGIEYEPDAR
jgi:glutamate-1-semialdehyde aminotransferase